MLNKLFATLKEESKNERELEELSMLIESSELRDSILDEDEKDKSNEGDEEDMDNIDIPESVEESFLLEALVENLPETIVDEASMRPLALLSPIGLVAYSSLSLQTFQKLVRSKESKKWITDKCEKAFNKAKAKNKNLVVDIPEGFSKRLKANFKSYTFSDSMNYDIYYTKDASHKFNLAIFVYNKTIKKFKLILWDKKKEDFEYITVNFGKFQINKDYDKDVELDD